MMNRLLKFRAYHSFQKKMVTTDDYILDGQAVRHFWYDVDCGHLDPKSVCEWIGIQDCDDKDVYEDDICEITCEYPNPRYAKGRKFVIEFVIDDIYGIGYQGRFVEEPDHTIRNLVDLEFRVIGNKIQNKDWEK